MDGFTWMKDHAPVICGQYTVWRRTGPRGGLATEAGYSWNGDEWHTRSGAVSKAVVAWQDPLLMKLEQEPKHE